MKWRIFNWLGIHKARVMGGSSADDVYYGCKWCGKPMAPPEETNT